MNNYWPNKSNNTEVHCIVLYVYYNKINFRENTVGTTLYKQKTSSVQHRAKINIVSAYNLHYYYDGIMGVNFLSHIHIMIWYHIHKKHLGNIYSLGKQIFTRKNLFLFVLARLQNYMITCMLFWDNRNESNFKLPLKHYFLLNLNTILNQSVCLAKIYNWN